MPVRESLANGAYQIVDKLGEGGFGSSFLVDDTRRQRQAALKILGAQGPDAHARLRREYDVLARLDHPAFAKVYDAGQLPDGRLFLVTELVRGRNLEKVLRDGPLPVESALAVARRLADGLGHLHALGYVHRDVKPSNVQIPGDPPDFERPTLLDFGVIGQLYMEGKERITQGGIIVGTPRYMSPEQIQGLSQSGATDVYGVALLLYEMLFGHLPHEDRGDTVIALMSRVIQSDPEIPERDDIPAHVRDLLARSLSRDPARRPANGADFAFALNTGMQVTRRARRTSQAMAMPVPAAPVRRSRADRVSEQRMLAAPRTFGRGVVIGLSVAVAASVIALVVTRAGVPSMSPGTALFAAAGWLALAIVLAAGGLLLANLIRRFARSRLHDVELDAERLLLGLKTKRRLSDTIAVEVTAIIARCRDIDERLLGITILKMIDEFDAAEGSPQHRQAALMNVATLLDKLRGRLSPWYARFEKQLSIATALIGVISGGLALVKGIVALAAGSPPSP